MKMISWQKTGTIIITTALALSIFLSGLAIYSIEKDANTRETTAIKAVIDKALLQCYALEGSYPTDVQYLADNYGIILNENDYFYYYEAYGANIFPDVTVLKK